jgi:hypothetical protein
MVVFGGADTYSSVSVQLPCSFGRSMTACLRNGGIIINSCNSIQNSVTIAVAYGYNVVTIRTYQRIIVVTSRAVNYSAQGKY